MTRNIDCLKLKEKIKREKFRSITEGSSTMRDNIRLTLKKRAGTDNVILSKVNIYISVSCFHEALLDRKAGGYS